MRRRTRWAGLLLALLVRARARRAAATTTTTATAASRTGPAAQAPSGDDPERTTRTRRRSSTIGSKNFTEQKVLGEIYAQALAAAGYTLDTELNLGDEKTALKALEARRDQRVPRVHRDGPDVVLRRDAADKIPKDPQEAYEQAKAGFAQGGHHRPAADAVHELERGRRDEGEGRRARAQEDLGPRGQVAGPDAVRHARVPPAAGLPARPGAGLRAEVQEVRAGRHRPAPRGARRRARPTCRSCSPPTRRSSARASSCSRTTRTCSRPTTRRSSIEDDGGQGGAGPRDGRRLRSTRASPTTVMQELNARVDLDKKTPE